MYVQANGPLCFLAHPRTASRATSDALGQRGFIMVGSHHGGPPNADLGGRTPFCVIRNHYDAICSWFFNWNRSGEPMTAKWIRSFVGGHHDYFKPKQMWWYTYLEPQPIILRYEYLQDELDALLTSYGLKPIRLPVVGRSRDRAGVHYREFHTADTVAAVRRLWGDEIDRFGYVY